MHIRWHGKQQFMQNPLPLLQRIELATSILNLAIFYAMGNTLVPLGLHGNAVVKSLADLAPIRKTIFYKGIMPSEKVLDFPVDCNTLTGSVNL